MMEVMILTGLNLLFLDEHVFAFLTVGVHTIKLRVTDKFGETDIAETTITVNEIQAGGVWAWGVNSNRQLGNNSSTASNIPVPAHDLGNVVDVATGIYHSLAIKSDGTVWAWGQNGSWGSCGIGSNITYCPAPVQVKLDNTNYLTGYYSNCRGMGTQWL